MLIALEPRDHEPENVLGTQSIMSNIGNPNKEPIVVRVRVSFILAHTFCGHQLIGTNCANTKLSNSRL